MKLVCGLFVVHKYNGEKQIFSQMVHQKTKADLLCPHSLLLRDASFIRNSWKRNKNFGMTVGDGKTRTSFYCLLTL